MNDGLRLCRHWLIGLCALAALAPALHAAGTGCFSAPAGLVGWWPGDASASDFAGANNGTLQGGATAGAAGLVGSAFAFDGTNAYVQIPDSPVLRPTNLTVEAWVLFSSLDSAGNAAAGQQYIVFKQNTLNSYFEGYNLGKARLAGGDVLTFIVSSALAPGSNQTALLQSASFVTTGVWYHVAGVRGSNFTELYVNGQLERRTNAAFAQDYGNFPLYFGTSGESYWDRKFNGLLDEVSLYNRALSSNEIAAIYAAGAVGKCKAPDITTQPQNQAVVVGTNALFTVTATGFGSLSYQWRFNGATLAGGTRANLALNNVQPTNAGSYAVVVTNSLGSATSTVATLTVGCPAVTLSPALLPSGLVGDAYSRSLAASGGAAPYAFAVTVGTLPPGLSLSGAGVVNGTPATIGTNSFVVTATDTNGCSGSQVCTLAVTGAPPIITLQPQSLTNAAGTTASFNATATGSTPLNYQWQLNGLNLVSGARISGATTNALTIASVQAADAGSYTLVVSNAAGVVTSAVATLTVTNLTVVPPSPPGSQSAGAVVLVNSSSANYADFQHFIQPYLDNFGVPYTVRDIATNGVGTNLDHYALIIIGHSQLDTNGTALGANGQDTISLAVSNGTGLVNFDGDLATPANVPRYTFVQQIFFFGYSATPTNVNVNFPATEPQSQMHYITARHTAGETIPLRAGLVSRALGLPTNVTAVARSGTQPLLAVTTYGQGRAVQWASYDWMSTAVLGPVDGMDDLVWRGLVWAARKPFVMRGLPNFLVLRMDDASGPFWWVQVANEMGFKPWIGLFLSGVAETNTTDLRNLVTNGNATTSIHSMDCCNTFFYYNHPGAMPWPDNVMSNYFVLGTQWHASHGIPISKVVICHYSEIGPNAFAGLQAWGVEYVGVCFSPGVAWYSNPPSGPPWEIGGPYRLYETPRSGTSDLYPAYYADFLSIPGHPEFNGQFFGCYTELRDDASCGEWCPENTDISGSIARGTRQSKRAFDSLVLATLYTHEWYLIPTPQVNLHPLMSTNNWRAILQGITNNLAAYNPIYVTYDYACQYLRATRTSRLTASDYDPLSGQVTVTLSGNTDLDIQVSVFVGSDNSITSSSATVPAFSGSTTNLAATLLTPRLKVALAPTNTVVLSWPNPSPGFGLQQNATFGAAHWTMVTNPPVVVGDALQVIITNPPGDQFYRLARP